MTEEKVKINATENKWQNGKVLQKAGTYQIQIHLFF